MIFFKTLFLLGTLVSSTFTAPAIKGRQVAASNQRPFYGTKGGSEGAASGQQEASLPAFVEPPEAPAPEPDAGEPMMPYSFEYTAEATGGMSARRESNDGQRVTGSYMLAGPDGINRIVHYVADKDGFRATITTNEPGTESQSPAATLLNSSQLPAEQIALMYGPREPIPQPTSARLAASPPIPALPAQIQSSPPAPRSAALISTSLAPSTTSSQTETTAAQTTRLTSPAPSAPAQSAPLRLLNTKGGTKGAPIVQQKQEQQTKSLRSPARSRPALPPPPPPAPLVIIRAPAKAPPQRVALPPPPPPQRPLSLPPPPPRAPALPPRPQRPLPVPQAPRAPSKARPQPTKLNQQKVARPFYIATTTTTTTTPPPPPPLLIVQQEEQQQEQQQEEEQVQQVEQVQQLEQIQQQEVQQQEVQQQQQEETQEQEQVQEVQQEQSGQESQLNQEEADEQEAQQSENQYANVYYHYGQRY